MLPSCVVWFFYNSKWTSRVVCRTFNLKKMHGDCLHAHIQIFTPCCAWLYLILWMEILCRKRISPLVQVTSLPFCSWIPLFTASGHPSQRQASKARLRHSLRFAFRLGLACCYAPQLLPNRTRGEPCLLAKDRAAPHTYCSQTLQSFTPCTADQHLWLSAACCQCTE